MPDDDLDPCGTVDFTDPDHLTEDGEQTVALALFADVDWTDPTAVGTRKAEWERLAEVSDQ
jgi:hypothetical protein